MQVKKSTYLICKHSRCVLLFIQVKGITSRSQGSSKKVLIAFKGFFQEVLYKIIAQLAPQMILEQCIGSSKTTGAKVA